MSDVDDRSNKPMAGHRCGTVVAFLRRNYFRVRLTDGQEVVAAMPERMLPLAAEAMGKLAGHPLAVEVRLRPTPRMHRITRCADACVSC